MGSTPRVVIVSGIIAAVSGCALPSADEADRFREPLPVQEEVALRVPGGDGVASGTRTASLGVRPLSDPPAGGLSTARYYRFTRDMTTAVDFGTAIMLGGIWAIVQQPPTTIEAKKAVWGPGSGNALEPAIWRFTVSEVGVAEYDYQLEGQLKSGGEWTSVLKGHGYGKSSADHKRGWFQWDNDAYRALEPARAKDEGTTKVTFDLGQLPATIAVEMRPAAADPAKGWADVTVTHEEGGAGSVVIAAFGDIDDSKTTKLEDIGLHSRWSSAGSGRADITMKNGDLPFTVDATECWSSSFQRVYYKDTVDHEPPSGDPSACAFASAKP